MTKSNSRAEDERRSEVTPDRVTRVHGGKVVETISQEDLISVNDADCVHERLLRDYSEEDYIAFTCANPNCGEVVLFSKEVNKKEN